MVRPLFELVCLMCQAWPAAGAAPPLSLLQEKLRLPAQVASELADFEGAHAERSLELVPPCRASSVGGQWGLERGRRLQLYLTPSPQHCAPLLEMAF